MWQLISSVNIAAANKFDWLAAFEAGMSATETCVRLAAPANFHAAVEVVTGGVPQFGPSATAALSTTLLTGYPDPVVWKVCWCPDCSLFPRAKYQSRCGVLVTFLLSIQNNLGETIAIVRVLRLVMLFGGTVVVFHLTVAASLVVAGFQLWGRVFPRPSTGQLWWLSTDHGEGEVGGCRGSGRSGGRARGIYRPIASVA